MGTDTIILAVSKWKQHCVFLLAQAKPEEASSPHFAASGQHCHLWAKCCLPLATAAALQPHRGGQEDRDQWRSPALSGRHQCASHCADRFNIPFSSPPSCFQRQTLRDVESCPASLFFLRNFWGNVIFYGKYGFSRVIPARPSQKTSWYL